MRSATLWRVVAASQAALMCLACLPAANASIVIQGTRVIYPGANADVSVKLENVGTTPSLTQIWIDDGDPQKEASKIAVPFVLTPPLSRIDAGKAQQIRIILSGGELPADRESVYWLNVLEIPAQAADASNGNRLELAYRSRIKLFYRPKALSGKSFGAPGLLEWRVKGSAVEINNPSEYHVTLSKALLKRSGQEFKLGEDSMIAPRQSRLAQLSGEPPHEGDIVVFEVINDYGSTSTFEGRLQ